MTMGAFAVDVGLAVFPFVSVQEKISFCLADEEQIFSVFLCTLVYVSGKHTVKHKRADHEGNGVQRNTNEIVFDEYRQHGDRDINDE